MKRVLYVEDDAINALVMKKLLGSLYDVTHVDGGEECLALLATNSFSLIMMDINLGKGKIDGVEVMKHIKARSTHTHVPVVAVTSYAMPEDGPRFLREGFDGYMAKPLNRAELLTFVASFVAS